MAFWQPGFRVLSFGESSEINNLVSHYEYAKLPEGIKLWNGSDSYAPRQYSYHYHQNRKCNDLKDV
jgi:hypothetical protein